VPDITPGPEDGNVFEPAVGDFLGAGGVTEREKGNDYNDAENGGEAQYFRSPPFQSRTSG
jgi:hypothetical protein